MTAASWPRTLLVPADARQQWQALREALLAVRGTPCASDPDVWHSRAADDIAAACDACLSCLAYDSCGAYADAANERAGVWAGRDRRRRPTRQGGSGVKTQERQERLARVQETARRKGYTVPTPPRGKYRYTLRSNRRGGATYLAGATLEAVERWLGTDEPPTPAPDFFGGKKYSTLRISDHLPPSKNHQRSHCDPRSA